MYDDQGDSGMAVPSPPPARARPVPALLLPTSPRYGYLVARLRNRQITMEEATELFGLLQDALATAAQAIRQAAASSAPGPEAGVRPALSAPGPNFPLAVRDEDIGLGLLAFGAGAGMLAAILKRSAEGPKQSGTK